MEGSSKRTCALGGRRKTQQNNAHRSSRREGSRSRPIWRWVHHQRWTFPEVRRDLTLVRAQWVFAGSTPSIGIGRRAIVENGEMEVWSRRVAGVTADPNLLSPSDPLTRFHQNLTEMAVQSDVAVS